MNHTSTSNSRRLGVDPGVTGAIALLTSDGDLISVTDMSTYTRATTGKRHVDAIALAALIRSLNPSSAAVEAVHAMARDGSVSAFSFGRSCRTVQTVFTRPTSARHMICNCHHGAGVSYSAGSTAYDTKSHRGI